MKAIIVTGTPGTGKTTLSLALQKELGIGYIDVTKLIKAKKLASGYDKKRDCAIVDVKKLNSCLISDLSKRASAVVIDSHMSHYLPKKHVKLCIVCTCKLKELKKRLKKKGYSDKKIRENLDCEIFETSLSEAKEKKHNILVIDTSKGIGGKTVEKVKAALWKVR
jgi:adenylate kinase